MGKNQSQQLLHELTRKKLEDPSSGLDIQDFAFEKIREQAKEEVKISLARVAFRSKYNLPPNDSRFLDLTDEEIMYDLILYKEYSNYMSGDEDKGEDVEIFKSDEKQFDDITKRLESGENIDLLSLKPESSWEKVE